MSLLKRICELERPINTPSLKWGRKNEDNARQTYQQRARTLHEDAKFEACGFPKLTLTLQRLRMSVFHALVAVTVFMNLNVHYLL